MTALADGIGYFAVFLGLFNYVSVRRRPIFVVKGITDALWIINFTLYGLKTAALIQCINLVRTVVFSCREKKTWAAHSALLVVFLLCALASPLLTWAGPVSLLPAVGSVLCCVGYYMRRPLALKCVVLLGMFFWMGYSILSANFPALLGNLFGVVSLVIGIVRELPKKRKKMI